MGLALLSDVHGNSVALDAVVQDIAARGGVDSYWVIGDLVALGHDSVGVLERLASLPNLVAVRGNTDRYTLSGTFPPVIDALMEQEGQPLTANLPTIITIARSYAWTCGAIVATGWLPWMQALPVEQRQVLPDGTRLLAVHAAAGHDDGDGIHPGLSEDQMRALIGDAAADLLCVGHTHFAMDVQIDQVRVLNLGSVSNPHAPDLRASYTLIDADPAGYQATHYRVDYDHDAVIAALERCGHPSATFLSAYHNLGKVGGRACCIGVR